REEERAEEESRGEKEEREKACPEGRQEALIGSVSRPPAPAPGAGMFSRQARIPRGQFPGRPHTQPHPAFPYEKHACVQRLNEIQCTVVVVKAGFCRFA